MQTVVDKDGRHMMIQDIKSYNPNRVVLDKNLCP